MSRGKQYPYDTGFSGRKEIKGNSKGGYPKSEHPPTFNQSILQPNLNFIQSYAPAYIKNPNPIINRKNIAIFN